MDCLFCKIINKEIPSYKIYEDDVVYAFLDINPDSVGHTLIIPKKHYLDLDDIDIEILKHIMEVAKMLKKRIEESHLHLKPFYNNKKDKTLEEVNELLK